MNLDNIPSSVLQQILLTRAMARADREIRRQEILYSKLRRKQGARQCELERQKSRASAIGDSAIGNSAPEAQ